MEKNTDLHERVRALRAQGLSQRQVAEACGISKVRVVQLENPYNPGRAAKRYACKRCGHGWTTRATVKPARCPVRGGCGSYYWNRADGESRTPGPKPRPARPLARSRAKAS